jgi:hypothetical protein
MQPLINTISRLKRADGASLIGLNASQTVADRFALEPLTPEQFGAKGDGVTNDRAAIQAMFDLVAAGKRPRTCIMSGASYKMNSGVSFDAGYTNIVASCLWDFSGAPDNTYCCTVYGTPSVFGNGYTYKGSITGQLAVTGSGPYKGQVLFQIDSPTTGTSTHIDWNNVALRNAAVGWRFYQRAYNHNFIKCEANTMGICFEWPNGGADNDEQNTIIGGTFFNSDRILVAARPAGCFRAYGCSFDYTGKVFEALSGKIYAEDCHYEASNWINYPFFANGDGGLIDISGGWLLMQSNLGNINRVFRSEGYSAIKVDGITTNNVIPAADSSTKFPTWASVVESGSFKMTNTHVGFKYGGFPKRLIDERTSLANPDFSQPITTDLIWRTSDEAPIISRDGTETPGNPTKNCILSIVAQTGPEGTTALRASKTYGSGSKCEFVLAAQYVNPGDKVLAGAICKVSDARYSGSTNAVIGVYYARINNFDANGIPVITRRQAGRIPPMSFTVSMPGTSNPWTKIDTLNEADTLIVPEWANVAMLVVNMFDSAGIDVLFQRAFIDTF